MRVTIICDTHLLIYKMIVTNFILRVTYTHITEHYLRCFMY